MSMTAILHPMKQPSLQDRLALCADAGIEAISERLDVLEREWPAGRMVKVTHGLAIVAGFLLAAYVNPLWLILPVASGAFLLQYCFFRRSVLGEIYQNLGFRSGAAIDEERLMLRALRGDFSALPTVHQVEDKDAIHRMEDEGGPAIETDDDRYDSREVAAILVTHAR